MAAVDLREQNDPLRDASRPYGQASADENALRSLASIGGGSSLSLPPRGGSGAPVPPLPSLVTDDAAPLVGSGTGEVDTGAAGPVAAGNARRGQGTDAGLGRSYDFMASNELISKALASFPPAVQSAFANRKIDRPATLPQDVYGAPSTAGGYYDPDTKSVVLARGNAQAYGNPNVDVGGTQHEILHAIAYEGQGFSQDREAGYPALRQALTQDLSTLLVNPQTQNAANDAIEKFRSNDPDHAFTALGILYVNGVTLPPDLASYFGQMRAYRPTSDEYETSPAVERGETVAPPQPRNPGDKWKTAPQDAANALGRFIHAGGAEVEQGWNDIVNGFGSALAAFDMHSALTGTSGASPWDIAGQRGRAVLSPVAGAGRIAASPFTAVAETARTGMVESIPELRGPYDQALAESLKSVPAGGDPAAVARQRASAEAAAASAAIDAGRTKLWNAAGDTSLPDETRRAALGAAALLSLETAGEFAVPSMLYRVPAAFRAIARSNLLGMLSRGGLPRPQQVAALDDAAQALAHEEDTTLSQIEGGLSGRIGAPAGGLGAGEANAGPMGAQKVATQAIANEADRATAVNLSTEAAAQDALRTRLAATVPAGLRRNLGDIVNERQRLTALRSQTLGEAPAILSAEDEQAILAGIHATAEDIGPQLEVRTQNLGTLMQNAAKNAERSMFAALRRAATEGETFRMRNVTVGEDAEGKAVRLRSMVGTFDQAIQSIRNVASTAGRESDAETLLAPFHAARQSALDALQSAEAYNAAVKRNASLAGQDYRTASMAARAAEREVTSAYGDVTRGGQAVAKKTARVGALEQKQAQRVEAASSRAEAGVDTARAQAATANERAQSRVGLAQARVDAATGNDALRQGTAVDTLQQRVDAAKAAAADAAQEVKIKVGGDKTPETANVATGYVSPEVSEVWQRNRLHTGTFDDPIVGDAMAEWVRAHPGEIDAGEHKWQEFTSSISTLTGADIQKVQRAIPKTGELTRTFYVAEQVFAQSVKEWQQLGKSVAEGYGTSQQLADKTAEVLAFEESLRRGIGELGRGLAARQLVKKADAVQVLAAGEKVRVSYAQVEKLSKQIDALEGQVAAARSADQSRRTAIATAQLAQIASLADTTAAAGAAKVAAAEEVARLADTLPESQALIDARGRLTAALDSFESAKGALDDARRASSEAADAAYTAALRKAVAEGATKQAVQVLAKFDPEDVVGIAAFLRSLKPQGAGALLMHAAVAGRYGHIPANILNFVGNNAYALVQELAVRPTTMLTAPVASKIAGVTVRSTPTTTAAAWMGLASNVPDATKYMVETLWQGSSPTLALKHGVADYEALIGQGLDSGSPVYNIAGRTFEMKGPAAIPFDISLRGLFGADGFSRILYDGADRRAMLAEKALSAGKGVDGAVQAVAQDLSASELEFLHKEALIKTFNEPVISQGAQGNSVQKLERAVMSGLGAVDIGGFQPLRLMIPAARYGSRQVQVGLRMSGFGLASGAKLALRARNVELTAEERLSLARQGTREMAEGAVGAGLLGFGFYLAGTGNLTGAYPTSVSERNRWQTLGTQPMSLKVGDHYLPLGWLGPLGVPFALAAVIHGASAESSDETNLDRIGRASQGLGQVVIDQPAFYATRNLIEGISNGLTQGNWEGMTNIVSQLAAVTSLAGMAESMTPVFDPYQRNPEGLIQRVFARYPGFSSLVPPRIDQRTGQPILRNVSGPGAIIATDLGTARTLDDLSPVERATLDVNIGNLSQTLTSGSASTKLTQDQFTSYQKDARKRGEDEAAKVMTSDAYKATGDAITRQAMLKAAYDRGAGAARLSLAGTLLTKAKTPDEVYQATVIARSAYPTYRYVLTVASLMADGRLTSDVAKKLDDTRGRHADGTSDPAVSDIRASAPLVRQYVAIRPFLRGDEREWAQVRDQRTEMAAVKSSKGDKAAAEYERAHPLIAMYANGAMTNPARQQFLDAHKSIASLVGGSEWDWVKN